MQDEDDKEVRCCYCGAAESECPHWLAVIDKTYSECVEGYAVDRFDEFRSPIEAAFLTALSLGERQTDRWTDEDVAAVWVEAVAKYSADAESVFLDRYCVIRLIESLFIEAGAKRYPSSISDRGGPGLTSALAVYFAKEPDKVFEKALSLLNARLGVSRRKRRTRGNRSENVRRRK